MEEAKAEVVVQRLDSGSKNEAGNYQCTACSWEGKEVGSAPARLLSLSCFLIPFRLQSFV